MIYSQDGLPILRGKSLRDKASSLLFNTSKYISSDRDNDNGDLYNHYYVPSHIYVQPELDHLLLDHALDFNTHSHFLPRGMPNLKRLHHAEKPPDADDNDDLHDFDDVPCNIHI